MPEYFLEVVGGEGLLLDAESGTLLRLNETATRIWQRSLAGETPEAIAEGLARDFAVALPRARTDVEQTLALTDVAPVPPIPGLAPEYRYEHRPERREYVLLFEGKELFAIDEAGLGLRPGEVSNPGVSFWTGHLWALLPKVLSLRGTFVLHASAVTKGDHAIAFTGISGAGKSTTAKALVRAGAAPVSDDKMILRFAPDAALAVRGGEKILRGTASAAAIALSHGQAAHFGGLDGIDEGDAIPVREIYCVAGRSEVGRETFAVASLHAAESASIFFLQSFVGSEARPEWMRQIASCARLAQLTAPFALRTPEGLDVLAKAAQAFLAS